MAAGTPSMGKYERMKKLGMPLNSITNRMRMDGIPAGIIEAWSGGGKAKKDGIEEKKILDVAPKARMKAFHWAKLNSSQIENTVWATSHTRLKKMEISFNEIDKLFPYQDASKKMKKADDEKGDSASGGKKSAGGDGILGPKRIQNVMIGLARIGLDENEILEAILKLDDKKLPPEKVRNLLPYVPTDGELTMVREYVKQGGDISKLSAAEKFFVKLMDLVAVKQMLKLWLLKSDFEPRVARIRDRVSLVRRLLERLQTSESLKLMFEVILTIGNYLNAGSSRGNAYGFCLEPTLDMIDGLKAVDKKTTLLVFAVGQMHAKYPKALEWVEEFSMISETSKITTKALKTDVDELKHDIAELEKRIKAHRRTMTKTHSDWAKDGGAIGLQHMATHVRSVSKQPKALQMAEFGNYGTLRAPIQVLKEEEEKQENRFAKIMLRFYKKENTTVRDIETELKKAENDMKKCALFFGCDEDAKWEEIFGIFAQFRDRFIKAERELQTSQKRKVVAMKREEQKSALAEKLAKRPQASKYVTASEKSAESASGKKGAGKGGDAEKKGKKKGGDANKRTLDMYSQFKKKKKKELVNKSAESGQGTMWV